MRKTKKRVLIFALAAVFLSAALYFNKTTQKYILNPIESLSLPAQNTASELKSVWKSIKNSKEYQNENLLLKEENAYLKNKIEKSKSIIQENARLREQLDFQKQNDELNLTACEVVGKSRRYLKINKGKKHGICENDVAILNNTLLGKVEITGNNWAKILLIVSEGVSVGAKSSESSLFVITQGDKNLSKEGKLKLICTDNAGDLKIGETIFSSGENSIYPKGFKIGTVVSKDKDGAILKTDINFRQISEVMILKRDK